MGHKHSYDQVMMLLAIISFIAVSNARVEVNIGVILDMESSVGKTSAICINMALDDFYQTHKDYKTRIVPHFRDSRHDRVEAASAAIQLIKDVQVMAIIGPQRSSQADFIVDIGNNAQVPILSLATIPSISPKENPYFIRVSYNSSSQAYTISQLIRSIPWREVVVVYQHGDFGTGFIPYLSESLSNVNVQIKQRVLISPFASDDVLSGHLHNLKTNQTRVFIVHLLPTLASRFFKKAKQAGMMQEGYAWIITDVATSLLNTIDTESMQGVVGVSPSIPRTDKLRNFEKRFSKTNPEESLSVYALWAYDTIYALAMAVERVGSATTFQQQKQPQPVTDLDALGTSSQGKLLLEEITKTKFKGLSGAFSLVDRQLQSQSTDYQLVNIVGKGRWKIVSLKDIVWPGGSKRAPRGWEIPATKESKLIVGYPAIDGFPEFIKIGTPPTGFCVDVFEAVMKGVSVNLSHPLSYDYRQYHIDKTTTSGNYTDLVQGILSKEYDVVIGDVTIRADRASYVDFTLPYTDSGVSMVVPVKKDDRKNAWVFLRPLEKQLWLTASVLFIYTGVVVWVLEHRVNKEFRGRPYKQVGMIFWFSFSTLVFAHKEKMISNLSRFVVIVWVFVVLVLQSSYIASLTSILTVQQLQPDFTDIHDLMRQGNNVGYKEGSFVAEMLKDMGFEDKKLIGYGSLEEYDEALSNGNVSAIFDELPYLKLFLVKHCNKYMMAGPIYKSAGFGFAFPKQSPLLPLVSKALLQVTENNTLANISDKWFKKIADCNGQDVGSGLSSGSGSNSGRLSLDSFLGLFLIAGSSSTCALIIYLSIFLYENKHMLQSDGSIRQKLSAIATAFHQEKQIEPPKDDDDHDHDHDDDDDDSLVIEDSVNHPPPTPETNHVSNSDDESLAHDIAETRIITTIDQPTRSWSSG